MSAAAPIATIRPIFKNFFIDHLQTLAPGRTTLERLRPRREQVPFLPMRERIAEESADQPHEVRLAADICRQSSALPRLDEMAV
jgi:hypothetical protein